MDVKNYTWYQIHSVGDERFHYKRFIYKTDIEKNGKDVILDISSNVNHPWSYGVMLLSKGYWTRYDRQKVDEQTPPEGIEKAERECLKSLFQVGLK